MRQPGLVVPDPTTTTWNSVTSGPAWIVRLHGNGALYTRSIAGSVSIVVAVPVPSA